MIDWELFLTKNNSKANWEINEISHIMNGLDALMHDHDFKKLSQVIKSNIHPDTHEQVIVILFIKTSPLKD